MPTMYPEFTRHFAHFFDDSLCGLKKLDKRDLTYTLSAVTCMDCLEKSREEAIENQKALDTLPHCPHCGERAAQVTLTFTVTKVFRLDVQTERDFESKTIKPIIYGSESDILDNEFVPDKEWQVACDNGHEWFTKKIEPIEDGAQWFVKEGIAEGNDYLKGDSKDQICPVCLCDRSEHNWEVHTMEMRNG